MPGPEKEPVQFLAVHGPFCCVPSLSRRVEELPPPTCSAPTSDILRQMPNNLLPLAIHVENISRALHFYEEVFGWRFETCGPPDFYLIHTGVEHDPGVLGLMYKPPKPVTGSGMSGCAYTIEVADIDKIMRAIESAGGKITMAKFQFSGVGMGCFFQDTEGNIMRAMQSGTTSSPRWPRPTPYPERIASPDFLELIVSSARTGERTAASSQIRDVARRFEIEYIESLDERLVDLDMPNFLAQQPYTFHLVRVPALLEGRVMRGLLDWFNGERGRVRVDAVEQNWTLYLSGGALGLPFTLGGFHPQYLQRMKVADAQAQAVRSAPVRVAVLDSGADGTIHFKTFYDIENNPPTVAGHWYDNDGHGTAMATLIQQVTPNAELYVIRVLDRLKVNLWHLMAGVQVAVGKCNADIVSMSLGIDKFITKCGRCGAATSVRQFAFEQVLSSTTSGGDCPIFVAATGNENSNSSFNFPASTGKCLAVGAVDSADVRTVVSNYGGTSRYYAMTPGGKKDMNTQQITEHVGTGGNGDPCFATSVSTAYAAGMLALMRGMDRFSHLSNDDLLTEMLQNHCKMPSHGTNSEYGRGVISFEPQVATTQLPVPVPPDPVGGSIEETANAVYIGGLRIPKRK